MFHVSEEPDIAQFVPRIPLRDDFDRSKGLVWAIGEHRLPNYLAPRDCPRVLYHAIPSTTRTDVDRFFSSSSLRSCIAIEHAWFERMAKVTLYLYELSTANFYAPVQGGGYVSEQTERPIAKIRIDHVFDELFRRNVEVRILDNLWELGDAVQQSTLDWSLIRMRNAQPRVDNRTD
jgi:hypothetical protein